MDLFEVVKCSTPVYTDLYIYNVKGIQFKCESSDSPVELFFCQHLFNRITGINIRVNQQISKPSICPNAEIKVERLWEPHSLGMWGSYDIRLWPFYLLGNSIKLLIKCLDSMLLASVHWHIKTCLHSPKYCGHVCRFCINNWRICNNSNIGPLFRWQWNPVQKGIVWVMLSLWMGNTMTSLDKSLVMIHMSSTVVRFPL